MLTILNFSVTSVEHKLRIYEHCPELQPYVGRKTVHLLPLQLLVLLGGISCMG